MKRKYIILFAILTFIIFETISIIVIYDNYKRDKHNYEQNRTNEFSQIYEKVVNMYSLAAELVYRGKIDQPEILELMKNAVSADSLEQEQIRNQLYAELLPIYKDLSNQNFRQLHFHLPDNRSFLRFHRPNKWGDDLTGVRASVVYVNKSLVKAKGFEEGKIINGFRFVFPLIFNNEHLGSVEISVSYRAIVDQIEIDNDLVCDFIIKEDVVKEKVFESELSNYKQCIISNDFMRETVTESKLNLRIINNNIPLSNIKTELTEEFNIDNLLKRNEAFTISGLTKREHSATFLPILNFEDKNVAYLIAYEKDNISKELQKRTLNFFISSFLTILTVVLFFSYILLNNQKRRKHITELTKLNKEIEMSNLRFSSMFLKHSAIMIIVDPNNESKIIDANESACNFYGYSIEEFKTLTIYDINVLSHKQIENRLHEASHNKSNIFIFQHKLANGEIRDVEVHSSPIMIDNDIYLYSIIRDITEYNKLQLKLNHAYELMSRFEKQIPGILYQFKIDKYGNFSSPYISGNLKKIYGAFSEDVKRNADLVFNKIHKDDIDTIYETIEQSKNNLTVWDQEYRIVVDGNVKWMRSTSKPMKNELGETIWYGYAYEITERKNLELNISRNFKLLNDLTEHVPGVIYQFLMFPDGSSCFPYATKGIYDVYNVYPDEVLDDAAPVFNHLHKDDYDGVVTSINESRENLSIWKDEYRVNLKNGMRWLRGVAKPEQLEDGSVLWHGYINDITEEKILNLNLKESELRLNLAINSTNAGLWDWNIKTGDEIFNENWAKICGYKLEELEPANIQTWIDLCHPDDLIKSNKLLDDHFKGLTDTYSCEIRLRHKSGKWIWVADTGKVVEWDKDGEPLRMVGTHIDITNRKKFEIELQENEKKLKNLVAEKDTFFSILAHDLKSPLGALVGVLEIIYTDDDVDKIEKQEFITAAYNSSRKIYKMLEDLLEWSLLQRNAIQFRPNILSINNIIEQVKGIVQENANKKNIYISTILNHRKNVYADKMMIQTVIRNILSNAIKFTPNNGKIEIKTNENDEFLILSIEDNGIGMSEALQKDLFKINKNISRQGTNKESGTGLGLILAREFMEINKGKLEFKSEENNGTIFYIKIPLYIIE